MEGLRFCNSRMRQAIKKGVIRGESNMKADPTARKFVTKDAYDQMVEQLINSSPTATAPSTPTAGRHRQKLHRLGRDQSGDGKIVSSTSYKKTTSAMGGTDLFCRRDKSNTQ